MNIAQITDLHLCLGLSWDVDVPARLQKILDDISGQKIDLIVLTGDLVRTETDEEAYVAIKQRLDAAGLPYRVVPGNHDDRPIVSRIFGLPLAASGEIYSGERAGDLHLLYLDSSQARFSPEQWRWLVRAVRAAKGGGSAPNGPILFMHHPPVPAGVTVMDRDWRFLESAEFRDRLLALKKPVTVFCGHYHTEKVVLEKFLDMFICPAAVFQFDPTEENLRVSSPKYGWRKIELADGCLATSVRYIDS